MLYLVLGALVASAVPGVFQGLEGCLTADLYNA